MSLPATILYVDDERINLVLFEHMFRKKYNVIVAESGYAGLDKLNENPDIKAIISDMKMPGMDGIEFLYKVKEMHPEVFFYVLSGYEISDEVNDAIEKGLIVKYFQKPINLNEIDESISEKVLV